MNSSMGSLVAIIPVPAVAMAGELASNPEHGATLIWIVGFTAVVGLLAAISTIYRNLKPSPTGEERIEKMAASIRTDFVSVTNKLEKGLDRVTDRLNDIDRQVARVGTKLESHLEQGNPNPRRTNK